MRVRSLFVKLMFFIEILLVSVLTGGCQSADETKIIPQSSEASVAASPIMTPPVSNPQPVFDSPVTTFTSPVTPSLPDPSEILAVAAQVTPETDKGAAVGQLLDVISLQPLPDISLYLAEIEGTEEFPVAALDREKDPFAMTNIKGIFQFTNLQPGKYVIIAGSEGKGGMIQDNAKNITLVLNVEQNKVTNVGQIIIEKP